MPPHTRSHTGAYGGASTRRRGVHVGRRERQPVHAEEADTLQRFRDGHPRTNELQGLESVLIIYGRRRTVLMILVGYIMGMALRTAGDDGAAVIGYIIPGLIAIWLSRQGLVETLAVLFTASAVVRLALIAVAGGDAFP